MMSTKEVSILLKHACQELSDQAQTNITVGLDNTIEDLIKYISLRWPDQAGFLYAGFDEARERYRNEVRRKGAIPRLASRAMSEN